MLIGLTTGYIIVYYGDLVFWATPEREGMTVGSIIITWLAYSVMAYVFLCVVSVFKVRNVWAVFLAGAFYGLWGIWWWNEPPEAMKALLVAGQKDVLFIRFALFALCTSAFLILAHWLYNRVMPFVFKPSKVELWFLGVVTFLYYAFITVPAAPKSLWVLPPLMAITFWALNKNRLIESQPDVISAFGTKVHPLKYLLLFFIPLVAIGIYFVALAVDAKLFTNKFVYYVFSGLGTIMWIASVVMLLTRRSATNDSATNDSANKKSNGSSHM